MDSKKTTGLAKQATEGSVHPGPWHAELAVVKVDAALDVVVVGNLNVRGFSFRARSLGFRTRPDVCFCLLCVATQAQEQV